ATGRDDAKPPVEVLELLASELDHRLEELWSIRVPHDERHARRRGLALTGGVIDEELSEIREHDLEPLGRRGSAQIQHGPPPSTRRAGWAMRRRVLFLCPSGGRDWASSSAAPEAQASFERA